MSSGFPLLLLRAGRSELWRGHDRLTAPLHTARSKYRQGMPSGAAIGFVSVWPLVRHRRQTARPLIPHAGAEPSHTPPRSGSRLLRRPALPCAHLGLWPPPAPAPSPCPRFGGARRPGQRRPGGSWLLSTGTPSRAAPDGPGAAPGAGGAAGALCGAGLPRLRPGCLPTDGACEARGRGLAARCSLRSLAKVALPPQQSADRSARPLGTHTTAGRAAPASGWGVSHCLEAGGLPPAPPGARIPREQNHARTEATTTGTRR